MSAGRASAKVKLGGRRVPSLRGRRKRDQPTTASTIPRIASPAQTTRFERSGRTVDGHGAGPLCREKTPSEASWHCAASYAALLIRRAGRPDPPRHAGVWWRPRRDYSGSQAAINEPPGGGVNGRDHGVNRNGLGAFRWRTETKDIPGQRIRERHQQEHGYANGNLCGSRHAGDSSTCYASLCDSNSTSRATRFDTSNRRVVTPAATEHP